LEQYNSLVAADDCLEIQLSPGAYALASLRTTISYSLVMVAVEGEVNISCAQEDQASLPDSPFWFQRYSNLSSRQSPLPPGDGEFFVQIQGVLWENCQRPLRFDAMDYVGISDCNFTGFTASAVDIFNSQTVQIEHSSFHNNSAPLQKGQYHSNSGGLGIAYHTEDTFYFTPSLPPSVNVTNCEFTSNSASFPRNGFQQQINQGLNNQIYFGRGGGMGVYLSEDHFNIRVNIESCRFYSNYAESFGGALYLYIDGYNTTHMFTVSGSNFTSNRADEGSFGGAIQVALLIRNTNSGPSQIRFTHCNFVNNSASFGGGLSVVQTYSQGAGNNITLRESCFEGNFASDVGSGVMFASLLYVQNRMSSHYYQVSDK
jgi:hypothetical protein